MQFGLFGSAAPKRGGPEFDSSEGFRDFIEYNVEAEALGLHSTFVVEHHFTGYGQVSASTLYSMKSLNPSLLSSSGPPRFAAALPNRPNCIGSPLYRWAA